MPTLQFNKTSLMLEYKDKFVSLDEVKTAIDAKKLNELFKNRLIFEDVNLDSESTLDSTLESINEITHIHLADILHRLSRLQASDFLYELYQICKENTLWILQVVHPRHDDFLSNWNYINAFLPKAILNLTSIGVHLQHQETAVMLDPEWQKAVDKQEFSYDDIEITSAQACNVIKAYQVSVLVKKATWSQLGTVEQAPQQLKNLVNDNMKQQLLKQLEDAHMRNDKNAAETIGKFLKGLR